MRDQLLSPALIAAYIPTSVIFIRYFSEELQYIPVHSEHIRG